MIWLSLHQTTIMHPVVHKGIKDAQDCFQWDMASCLSTEKYLTAEKFMFLTGLLKQQLLHITCLTHSFQRASWQGEAAPNHWHTQKKIRNEQLGILNTLSARCFSHISKPKWQKHIHILRYEKKNMTWYKARPSQGRSECTRVCERPLCPTYQRKRAP